MRKLTPFQRTLVNRCVREAILFSLAGDFPKERILTYKRDLKAATPETLAHEMQMSAFNDYPKAQEYMSKGGIAARRKALRVILGTETNQRFN